MANPVTRHAHSVAQVFDLLPGSSTAANRVQRLLEDRDRSIENAIDAGLRKTVSVAKFGDDSNVTTVFPAWTNHLNRVRVQVEKQHQSSRFEVDAAIAGSSAIGPGIVVVGASYVPVDGSAAAVDVFLGQCPFGAAGTFLGYPVHQQIAQGAPPALYWVELRMAVSAGSAWKMNASAVSSLRVTESLY